MKLAVLIPEFPAQTHAFFWREIEAIRSMGLHVSLVSTRRPPIDSCRHDFAEPAAKQTLYLFPPDWLNDTLFLARHPLRVVRAIGYIFRLKESSWLQRIATFPLFLPAARLCRFVLANSIHHIHVHSFANSAHVAAISKLLGGSDFSLALHGDLEVYGRDHVNKIELATFIRCVTSPLKNQLIESLTSPYPRIHLLRMGVDTSKFRPTSRAVRRVEDPFQVITVARLHQNKGHRFTLRAIRKLVDDGLDVRYTIVGDGPAHDALEREVVNLQLSGAVTLAGTKSETEVLQMLHASDALVLSSIGLGEAAPVAVMEAMACALPVICSIIGGTQEMISHNLDGFLVDQEDVAGIANCIKKLINDPETASRMGLAARTRAEQHFDSLVSANALIKLINLDKEGQRVDKLGN